ncbi:hypothetical protein [Endozoicomonas sp. ONNA1]|uniref:hypothetical protein n=1 Tax=Endozoicomonas sp. ONNA1 TaxID=2828740 RepID=UPI0034D2D2C6
MPLYRYGQVSILKRLNVDISRATLANWMIWTVQLLTQLPLHRNILPFGLDRPVC